MPVRFGLGRKEEFSVMAAQQLPSRLAVRCTRAGCGSDVGWACSYRDRFGAPCDTWWCRNHVEFVEGLALCKRHAGVVKTINRVRGTVREVKTIPEVADRSASLANLIGDDLDQPLVALLEHRFRARSDVSVTADRAPRDVWVERKEMAWDEHNHPYLKRMGTELAWERRWAALNHQGHVVRITVRVSTTEPPIVQALVGNRPVAEGTPDWILRRLTHEPGDDARDRAQFRDKLLLAISDSL